MLVILALFAVVSAGLAAAQTTPRHADLVVENAVIYTGAQTPGDVKARSFLAVEGTRIAYVGPPDATRIGPKTRRIDARGAVVVPGFIDSHAHMAGLGDMLESLDLRGVASVAKVAEMVREAARKRSPGEWIRGRAWDQTNWGGEFPTEKPLSDAAPDHPVLLGRVDGHAAWANRKALAIAGVSRDTPDPPGGKLIRDSQGNPTGVLIDRAIGLVSSKIPPRTSEQIERQLRAAAAECARLGVTGVHDAGVGKAEIDAYRRLMSKGDFPVRVYAMVGGAGDLWRDYLKRGPEIGEYLTVRSIKLVADGAMGSRGAALHSAYADDSGNTGLLLLTADQIRDIAQEALERGFQVNTHAIGDRANSTVLQAYASVLPGPNDKRFRIEHAQIVRPSEFALFRKSSVIASIQSTHATSDMRWAKARLGDDRISGAWAAKTFLNNGVRIANGSDFPVEQVNPLLGFYAAVSRQDVSGAPREGFRPDEKLSREEALKSWTVDGAYAAFEEANKGTLEAGKLADFALLSADIMTVPARDILKTRVLKTVVGGRVVYSE